MKVEMTVGVGSRPISPMGMLVIFVVAMFMVVPQAIPNGATVCWLPEELSDTP